MVQSINLYDLLEQHAVAIAAQLDGLNAEQWMIRVTVEDAEGRTLEQALRIVFKPE